MNLLIHDLDQKEWNEVSSQYEGWEIISENSKIHPCCGCFKCWTKTPGECVIKDGYDHTRASHLRLALFCSTRPSSETMLAYCFI